MHSDLDFETLLAKWKLGNRDALDCLVPLVYDELRRIARAHTRGQPAGHSLQTTAIVNEAYVRLASGTPPDLEGRSHFFRLAGQLMRNIVVDHARARIAAKRGGGASRVELDSAAAATEDNSELILAVDQALSRLATLDERQARIVELRYFVGMDISEVADVLGLSERTIKREWTHARAWLASEFSAKLP